MRKILLGLVALAALVTPLALTAAPANAYGEDHRPCVTQGEFDRVHRGMSLQQIHAIFDTAGRYQGYWSDPWWESDRDIYRDYATCGGWNRWQRVEINFDNYMHWRPGMTMWSKTARTGLY